MIDENSDENWSWNGKKILVTGGAGFVGKNVVDRLLKQHARVTVYDNFTTGDQTMMDDTREGLNVIPGNLLDYRKLCTVMAHGFDFVFHLAAHADIRSNLQEPRKCLDNNIVATQNLLQAMQEFEVENIAFASSGAVYGDSAGPPGGVREYEVFPVQTSLYGASKVAAEGLITAYSHGHGFNSWIFRFVSLLGPGYTHGHVADFYAQLLADPTKLVVQGNGEQKKSYLHVSDCVDAMFLAIEKTWNDEGNVQIFNIGHGSVISVNESIRVITTVMDLSPEVQYVGGERGWPGDAPILFLDCSHLYDKTGWSEEHGIPESIVSTLDSLSGKGGDA